MSNEQNCHGKHLLIKQQKRHNQTESKSTITETQEGGEELIWATYSPSTCTPPPPPPSHFPLAMGLNREKTPNAQINQLVSGSKFCL